MKFRLTQWVDALTAAEPSLAEIAPSVENELLAMAVFEVVEREKLLPEDAVFIGGTALRFCHGSPRFSEDLDYHTPSFAPRSLDRTVLRTGIEDIIGCEVSVSTPTSETKSTLARITAVLPERPRDKPRPRTKIDVGAGRQLDASMTLVMLRMAGGTVMGMGDFADPLSRLVSSKEEILADKHLALVGRKRRIKHRDIFDILWLHHQGVRFNADLLAAKLRPNNSDGFTKLLRQRAQAAKNAIAGGSYHEEMRRFLPTGSAWLFEGDEQRNMAAGCETLIVDNAKTLERVLSRTVISP